HQAFIEAVDHLVPPDITAPQWNNDGMEASHDKPFQADYSAKARKHGAPNQQLHCRICTADTVRFVDRKNNKKRNDADATEHVTRNEYAQAIDERPLQVEAD